MPFQRAKIDPGTFEQITRGGNLEAIRFEMTMRCTAGNEKAAFIRITDSGVLAAFEAASNKGQRRVALRDEIRRQVKDQWEYWDAEVPAAKVPGADDDALDADITTLP